MEFDRDDGATTSEYALLGGLIAVAIAATVGTVGDGLIAAFSDFLSRTGWG